MHSKGILSRTARVIKQGLKAAFTQTVGKLLQKRSFPLFGIPSGLEFHIESKKGSKKELYPPQTLNLLRPPRSIDKISHRCFEENLKGIQLPENGVLTVQNGLATSKGGNLSSQGKLITTYLQLIDAKPPHKNELFNLSSKSFFPKIYKAESPVITLAAGWQGAFYHWIYEVLPRLHLVEKAGIPIQTLYVETRLPFQKESLKMLGIEEKQIIAANQYQGLKTPQLIIPSIPALPAKWSCHYLREKFLPLLASKTPLRLYISRKDASRRRVINEDEIFNFLEQFGFQKVELSLLSFKEQAEYFAAADIVIGPHGAGFSHLVFCKPQTPFLEFFSPAYVNACYWHLCDRVGLQYHYLFGEGEHDPTINHLHLDPDIFIDLSKLKATLQFMGFPTY